MRRGLPHIILPILIMISFGYFFSPKVQLQAANKELPPTVKQVIEKTVVNFLGDDVKKELSPEEQERALTQLVNQVTNQFVSFIGPYFRFMPPILAFGLFLILQSLSIIFIWISIAFSILLFWIFKLTGLVKIKIVTREAEELEI